METFWYIMVKKQGKTFYLNAPRFKSEGDAIKYATENNVKNYTLKSREVEIED